MTKNLVLKILHWTLSFIILFFVVYLLFDLIIMPAYTRHGQKITVPDLTSMFYEDARDNLHRLDLKIIEEAKKFDTNNQFPIGVVMAQNPAPHTEVKKGRRIYVIVSKGEPVIEMPDLVHRSERNAIFTLEKLGLTVGNVEYEHSEIFHTGEIAGQSIPVSAEIKQGTVVNIIVSLGQFPDRFIVPELIGKSLNDAKKIILQSGLTLGEVSFQNEQDLLPGTVIYQAPAANLEVAQRDTIHLLVSKIAEEFRE